MRIEMKFIIVLAALFALVTSTKAQTEDLLLDYVNNLPKQELTQEEIDGIYYMREEEKLARDVYLELYDIWGTNIFSNIAKSEQSHMDWVKLLIDKYELQDPMINDVGKFSDEMLQELFDQLLELGSQSAEQAMFVGCTIEDVDIYDIDIRIAETDNIDVQAIYQNLLKGSRNHMRAFSRQYDNYGQSYSAQYITQGKLESILASGQEPGVVDENGDLIVGASVFNQANGNMIQALNYPNPCSEYTTIIIDTDSSFESQLEIIDIKGNTNFVMDRLYLQRGQNEILLNVKGLPPGNYLFRLIGNSEVFSGMLSVW
jgi:hypothetical protein